jgi:hypothetical protein
VSERHVKLRASAEHYREFLRSPVWEDIQQEVTAWMEDARDGLEQASEPKELYRLQGIAQAHREFLRLPETFLEALEDISVHGRDV